MLYQYTNVSSLALILSNRTIRFRPLTCMDDLQEQETADIKNLGQFCFVSCWTEDATEQIPMWKMYTDLDSGVRISLSKYPFQEYENKPEDLSKALGVPVKDSTNGIYLKSLIPAWKMIQEGYSTPGLVQQKNILHKIEYTSDRNKLYPKTFEEAGERKNLHIGLLGKYKNLGWSFQKEWRYIVLFFPFSIDPNDPYESNIKATQALNRMMTGTISLPFSHYDFSINDEAFSQMEIMLSPKISAGNRLIVKDLVEKYNPKATISESNFKDTIA